MDEIIKVKWEYSNREFEYDKDTMILTVKDKHPISINHLSSFIRNLEELKDTEQS